MYNKAMALFLLTETPLHAGSGREVGNVDLPIQRERVTQYPLVQASGVKGKLRAEAQATPAFRQRYEAYLQEEVADIIDDNQDEEHIHKEAKQRAWRKAAKALGVEAVFGPDWTAAEEHAGAVSPGDAKILLFPVRSLAGVFAWVTSAAVLARLNRDVVVPSGEDALPQPIPSAGEALVASENEVTVGDTVVLEEYSYTAVPDERVDVISEWLVRRALPAGEAYDYWRQKLSRSLIVLPEVDFRDFVLYGTEIVTRIRLEDETKTVAKGALWTEENLPADSLLYTVLYASPPSAPASTIVTAEDVLRFITDLELARLQLGGNEMVGRGLTAVRYGEVFGV